MSFIYSICIPLLVSIIAIVTFVFFYRNEKQQEIDIAKLVDYHWKKYYENQRKRLSYNKMQQYCEKNIN